MNAATVVCFHTTQQRPGDRRKVKWTPRVHMWSHVGRNLRNIITIPGCCRGSPKVLELTHFHVFYAINRVGTQASLSLDYIMRIFYGLLLWRELDDQLTAAGWERRFGLRKEKNGGNISTTYILIILSAQISNNIPLIQALILFVSLCSTVGGVVVHKELIHLTHWSHKDLK